MSGAVLVTGATRGIGHVAARFLLGSDQARHLVVPVRDPGRDDLAAELTAATGNPRVHVLPCDLADLASVRAFAAEVAGRLEAGALPPLAGIACNAGVQVPTAERATADGLELTFGVNVVAHQLLLRLLVPRLTAPARVVLVTSGTHWGTFAHTGNTMPKPRWRPVEELARPGSVAKPGTGRAGRQAYVTSKLALVHLAHEWARRAPSGVEVFAYDPGLVTGTNLARHYGRAAEFAYQVLFRPVALLPLATTPLLAGRRLAHATVGTVPARSGDYLELGRVAPSSPESYDPAREAELWRGLDRLLGI